MRPRPSGSSDRCDRGDTLIEVLMAVVIMGIAVTAVIGGLLTTVSLSSLHRNQSSAGAEVRNFGETLVKYAAATGYTACATTSTYAPATVGYTAPTGFTAATSSVKYYTGTPATPWGASCVVATDLGVQQITITVTGKDVKSTESLTVVLRKPCGAGSTCS